MKRLLAGLLLVLACAGAWAQGLLPVPALSARVIDQTGTLAAADRQALEDKLAAFEQDKGTQLVVLLVASTQPEDIASYANRVANSWQIGRREVGDGLLVIVAKQDRRVRIEVAKSLEGAVPDLAASRIIEDAITPRFRQGDFAGGLQAATDQLIARVKGEALPEPEAKAPRSSVMGFDWADLAIFLFFAVPLVGRVLGSLFGRKLGAVLAGGAVGAIAYFVTFSLLVAGIAAVIALIVVLVFGAGGLGGRNWSSGGSSSWGGGSSGGSWGGGFSDGGGFSSGGGGDFGGGGASGDW